MHVKLRIKKSIYNDNIGSIKNVEEKFTSFYFNVNMKNIYFDL